jgi:hypothetical protein
MRSAFGAAALVWRIAARPNDQSAVFAALRKGFADLGYIDGKTMVLEYRFAKGDSEALPKRARELVDDQPRSFVITIVPRRTCRGDTVSDRDRTLTVADS